MGYRIVYRPVKKLRQQHRSRARRTALIGVAFLCFMWVVGSFWEEGRAVLCGMFPVADRVMDAMGSLTDWFRKMLVVNGDGIS